MFNGERLKIAREVQGLTQMALAEATGLDQPFISLAEQTAKIPSDAVLETLALATGFPRTFFELGKPPDFPLGSLLFRKKNLSKADGARIYQLARVTMELFLALQRRIKPIPVTIPRVDGTDPVQAAQIIRSALGYSPDGPIRGLLNRMERAGILVFRAPVTLDDFDAFSAWSAEEDSRPVVVLGAPKDGERDRATAAHEVGHLAMHRVFLGDLASVERDALRFAGELLLPESDMQQEIGPTLTLTRLAELKQKWGVSMQFLLWRFEALGLISPQVKSYWRGRMFRQGWLEESEPLKMESEPPRLLRQMLEACYGAPVDARKVARDFGVPARLVADLIRVNGNGSKPATASSASTPAQSGKERPSSNTGKDKVLAFRSRPS